MSRPLNLTDRESFTRDTWLTGQVLLFVVGLTGLVVILIIGAMHPMLLAPIPLLALVAVLLPFLIQNPLLHLTLVLVGYVTLVDYNEGIRAREVIYGLYYLCYLAGWYLKHAFIDRDLGPVHGYEKALLFFVGFSVFSLLLTIPLGNEFPRAFSEWIPLTFLAFHFPIKHALLNYKNTIRYLLIALFVIVLFVLVRNFLEYYISLQNAQRLLKYYSGRERQNERFLLLGVLAAIPFMLYSARLRINALFLSLAGLSMAGVVLGQSRAVWLALAIGMIMLFLLQDLRTRVQFAFVTIISGVLSTLVFAVLLDDLFLVMWDILTNRFLSLGSAASSDISLLNRFIEWKSALHTAIQSPVLGHGFAFDYTYFSLEYRSTYTKSHIHSTYLGLFYRHGIIGLLAFGVFYFGALRHGLRAIRSPHLDRWQLSALSFAIVALVSLAVAGLTEDLLLNDDGTYVIMLPIAMIAGIVASSVSQPESNDA